MLYPLSYEGSTGRIILATRTSAGFEPAPTAQLAGLGNPVHAMRRQPKSQPARPDQLASCLLKHSAEDAGPTI